MGDIAEFESRTGKLSSGNECVFNFVTDIRNFKRFMPEGKISNVILGSDSCSFQVNMVGIVNVHIAEKVPFTRVLFSGNALRDNNFTLELKIEKSGIDSSEAKIFFKAELNPILKMMATEPVRQLLETLISEMEKFTDWENSGS